MLPPPELRARTQLKMTTSASRPCACSLVLKALVMQGKGLINLNLTPNLEKVFQVSLICALPYALFSLKTLARWRLRRPTWE